LVILLKDNNAEIRMESALALGKLGAQEALLDIKGLLMDDNSEVQASAAIALGRLGNKEEAITYLRKLIKKGKNPDARGAAAQGLAEFGVKDAIPDMINLIREKIDGTYGDGISGDRHCIEALGVLDAKEAIPDLIKLFRMEVANGRSSDQLSKIKSGMRVRDLADTLGRLGAREIAAEIIPLLNDREYEFYLDDLIKSLGGFGDKAAIPELAKFLKHAGDQPGDVRIRGWAAVSLIELGARNQVPNELAKDLKSIIRWNDADEFLYDKNRARNALKTLSSGSEAPK
jgi:HEAT repeat protein